MSNFTFELDTAGVAELLQSAEALSLVQEAAEEYLSGLGGGYSISSLAIIKDRASALISADSDEAYQDNLDNNTMLKGLS